MSGTPTTAVLDRVALVAVARELARVLREEIKELDGNARGLELRGYPMFAAECRTMRQRCTVLLKSAWAGVKAGGAA